MNEKKEFDFLEFLWPVITFALILGFIWLISLGSSSSTDYGDLTEEEIRWMQEDQENDRMDDYGTGGRI